MVLCLKGLRKSYAAGSAVELEVLHGIDLTLARGEFAALIGPSGSGKSTLLHIVGALESPTAGTIAVGGLRFDGLDDKALTELRRDRIGFVFQFFNLLPSLTAEENVTLPAVIAKRHDGVVRERARALLDRVGLADRMDHLPAELSGGQQQRVSIARALLLEPDLVLADEPTGNLDTKSSREVLRILRELNEEEGHTIVMVTHDAAAAATADRVIFLRDGRLAGEVEGGSTRRAADYLASLQSEDERESLVAV